MIELRVKLPKDEAMLDGLYQHLSDLSEQLLREKILNEHWSSLPYQTRYKKGAKYYARQLKNVLKIQTAFLKMRGLNKARK